MCFTSFINHLYFFRTSACTYSSDLKSGKATSSAVRRLPEGGAGTAPGIGGHAMAQGSKWTLGEPTVPLLLSMSHRTDVSSSHAPAPVTSPAQQTGEEVSSPPHVYAQAVRVGGPLDAPAEAATGEGAGDTNKEQRSGSGHPYVGQTVGGRDTPLEIRDMDKSPVPPTKPTAHQLD